MKWCDTKYLFPITKFFTRHLDDDWESFEDKNTSRYEQDYERIGHRCHDDERRPEREWSDISHHEFRGFDIIPEESDEGSCDDETECREDKKSLMVADECIHRVVKKEESSCESIESICDIHRVRHRDDDEREEWHISPAERKVSEIGNTDFLDSEFWVKPPRSYPREKHEKNHFHSSRKTLRTTDSTYIQIVIE